MDIRRSAAALTAAACLLAPAPAAAAESGGGFGLGVIAGEPTGLSLKFLTGGGRHGVDAAIAWSFSDGTDFHVHVDYLWHDPDLIAVDKGTLTFYWGVGGRLRVDNRNDDNLGVRIPVGLSYEFQGAPVDVFGELAPILDLTPDTELAGNGGLGVRFWFR